MKIQFTKMHTDGFGKTYLPGWVADWSQPAAERAIQDGFAVIAPEGAFPRKQTAPSFECATPTLVPPFEKTDEINLDDLPETAKQEARKKEGGFFSKK